MFSDTMQSPGRPALIHFYRTTLYYNWTRTSTQDNELKQSTSTTVMVAMVMPLQLRFDTRPIPHHPQTLQIIASPVQRITVLCCPLTSGSLISLSKRTLDGKIFALCGILYPTSSSSTPQINPYPYSQPPSKPDAQWQVHHHSQQTASSRPMWHSRDLLVRPGRFRMCGLRLKPNRPKWHCLCVWIKREDLA
ncbi:hypothetical protein BJX70DRAFT_272825 [Aspergillus crustosus]